MSNSIKVNTHHAFLNSDIILSCTGSSVSLTDKLTGFSYKIGEKPICIHLTAGKHILRSESLDEEVCIEIEDAIKLGGSTLNKAFVFDNNPWIFVTTKDRLYAVNTESHDEKVEYNLTPEEVRDFGKYYGKACEYFLLKSKEDYSIYNALTGANIFRFSNHIYSNSHLVIYKQEDTVIVYNYRSGRTITSFCGEYSFGNKFYFVKENKLYGLNLSSDYINVVPNVGAMEGDFILDGNYLLKLTKDNRGRKNYSLFSLGNGETTIEETKMELPFYIESWNGHRTIEFSRLIDKFNDSKKEFAQVSSKCPEAQLVCSGLRIESVRHPWKDKVKQTIMSGEIVTIPAMSYKVPFVVTSTQSSISFSDVKIEKDSVSVEKVTEKETKELKLLEGEKLIGISYSGNKIVVKSEKQLLVRDVMTGTTEPILTEILDTTSYNSAYFTSDGKNVVFQNCDKTYGIMGFKDFVKYPFSIEGSTVSKLSGFNGYKPEITIIEEGGKDPVWRDPISLKRIGAGEMSDHIFMSPDGNYTADLQKKTVHFNRLTNEEMTSEQFRKTCDKYNWSSRTDEKEKNQKIFARKSLLKEYGASRLFERLHQYNDNLIHRAQDGKLNEKAIEKRIQELNVSSEKEYLESKEMFTELFIDNLGYVSYKEKNSDEERRVLIGRSARYLNYVSFSYDSHYLAFGAKMAEDTWRHSEEGVFEIFDLRKKEVVIRKDTQFDLYAVWMTMFNKNGDVAFYDSHANAYISYAESDYKISNEAKGKSLLCFSPSGRYIALSDQKYIDYAHHPNEHWGHQPSGNIFIHDANDLERCLEQYNDFGDGISGTTSMTRRAGNVASAAFSSDEKHLLAVGDDGVIVIRNLHLDMYEDDEYCLPTAGSDEKRFYRRAERNGIVTLTCVTYDGVRNEVVDFWCNPDETLDSEQGLIFSEDMRELKKCLNIYNEEYHLPEGVKTICENTFHGRYAPGEGDYNALRVLYLPDSIEEIEDDFSECPGLEKICVSEMLRERILKLIPDFADKICIIKEQEYASK